MNPLRVRPTTHDSHPGRSLDSVPRLSLIIPTRNRATLLEDALRSFADTHKGPTPYEVIVVDNGSSDNTRQVVNRFVAEDTSVRYVFEPKAGASHARNVGVNQSRGEIIAFVDDDEYFDKEWFERIIEVFDLRPDIACAGGRIIALFEDGAPEWVTPDILSAFSAFDFGEGIRDMEFPHSPFGGNMAFRRGVFRKIGLFDTSLGRKKGNLLSNEEEELFYRIHAGGLKCAFTSYAIVYNQVLRARTQKSWVLRRYYWGGISDVIFWQITKPKSRSDLLSEAIADGITLMQNLTGGYLSPLRAYRHYRGSRFADRLHYAYLLGRIKQRLVEALWP